ncbi:MAG TPA: helix-turn-helix transcriptional regulator [Symbiobacteriaceae bacterium]|nr:helix-turn-helix transcriptional regulator [Symbiobacteriaceae bacterium]
MNIAPEKIRTWVESELVMGLTEGAINPREAWQYVNHLGWPALPDSALVVGIDHFARLVENKSERFRQEVRRKVLACVRRALAHLPAGACLYGGDRVTVLLCTRTATALPGMAAEVPDPAAVVGLAAEAVMQRVSEQGLCTVTIGASRSYPDPRDLPLAHAEATHAQHAKFLLGRGRLIRAEDVPGGQAPAPIPSAEGVARAALSRDMAALRLAVGDLFSGVSSPAEARVRALAAGFACFKAALACGADEAALARTGSAFLMQAGRFDLLQDLKELVVESAAALLTPERADPVEEARVYVRHNYHSACRVEDVARSVHLSPFHFCRIFRKQTGQSFLEYLTAERVQQAGSLLKNTDLTVDEVARRVGYQKASYFCRRFRERTGQTPSEFRREVRRAQ